MPHVLEIVRFATVPGTGAAQVVAAQQQVRGFLATCDGFVSRRLTITPGGTYVDVVEWQSLAHATAAQQKFMASPACAGFMELIDPRSVSAEHVEVAWAA